MQGKTLKVIEYNLTYGAKDRYVNVLGFFRYRKNGNLYVIYVDLDTKYEILYYGSGHLKNNNLLAMACREDDVEIIKEYVYKVINAQNMDDFETYSLDDIEGMELISSNRLEVKLDVIRKMVELTVAKKEEKNVVVESKKVSKLPKKFIGLFLIGIIVIGGGCFYLATIIGNENIIKSVQCVKENKAKEIGAVVEETNLYSFSENDKLKNINSVIMYKFDSKSDYENFINTGKIYSYMPEFSVEHKPNVDDLTIEYIVKLDIDSSYSKPIEYESVINYYTNSGYNCSEKIEK